jgi:hypothetical protein
MNILRSLLHRQDPVDLRRHEKIVRDIEEMKRELRRREPITRMIQGTWHDDEPQQRKDEHHA